MKLSVILCKQSNKPIPIYFNLNQFHGVTEHPQSHTQCIFQQRTNFRVIWFQYIGLKSRIRIVKNSDFRSTDDHLNGFELSDPDKRFQL